MVDGAGITQQLRIIKGDTGRISPSVFFFVDNFEFQFTDDKNQVGSMDISKEWNISINTQEYDFFEVVVYKK